MRPLAHGDDVTLPDLIARSAGGAGYRPSSGTQEGES